MTQGSERLSPEREFLQKIRSLEERLKKEPTAANYIALAKAYHKIRLFDHVIKIVKKALIRFPGDAECQYWLGRTYFDKGMIHVAQEILDGVAESLPNHLPTIKILGHIACKEREIGKAIQYYRHVLQLDPTQEEIRNILELLKDRMSSVPDQASAVSMSEPVSQDAGRDFHAGESSGAGSVNTSEIERLEAEFFSAEDSSSAQEDAPTRYLSPSSAKTGSENEGPSGKSKGWEEWHSPRNTQAYHQEEEEKKILENLKTLSDWLKNVKRELC